MEQLSSLNRLLYRLALEFLYKPAMGEPIYFS
jgi:hypothetical protein